MEKRKQVGYPVAIDLANCDVRFWADGNCLDSPDSPIRIKDGQRLIVHKYNGLFNPYADIDKVRDKICAILYIVEGVRYAIVKQIVGIDEITGTIRLKYYNPEETIVSLKIDTIEKLYVVDGVEE
jgi:hypothetical protein